MFTNHTYCRACGLGKPAIPTLKISDAAGPAPQEQKLIEVLDLGLMPLANDFRSAEEERAGYAPLKLLWCPNCTLAQLSVVVNPSVLYSNYAYLTSASQTMKDHFEKLTADLLAECKPCASAVEIGSNDGAYLEYLLKAGVPHGTGIEPAENLAKLSLARNVPTWNTFFDAATARSLSEVPPDLIVMRHVFCHIDNWQETIHNLGVASGRDTVIAIEVPYLPDTLLNVEFDQLYHEHTSYLTVKAMHAALQGSMLHVHATKHYTIHGGAIMLLLRRNDYEGQPCTMLNDNVTLHDLQFFAQQTRQQIACFKETVSHLVSSGKTVVGYGASAKCAQWISACGFTRKQIRWVCDCTPQKQYKLMPGTDIPVVDEGALTRELPDYAICFAWNFADFIIAKEQIFKAKGGRWIIPHGDIRVV